MNLPKLCVPMVNCILINWRCLPNSEYKFQAPLYSNSLKNPCFNFCLRFQRQNQSRRSELSKPVPKKLEPTTCICQRPKTLLTCHKCNFRLVGRVRQTCPIHPRTSFLMDLSQCPKCFAFDEMVEEKT